jgi:hypothetical protein
MTSTSEGFSQEAFELQQPSLLFAAAALTMQATSIVL